MFQILAGVEIDQPLGVPGEACHQEVLVVIGPDDPGSLLGDDVTPLLQRLRALAGVIDPIFQRKYVLTFSLLKELKVCKSL